jgi:hypothetical protein
VSLSSSTNTGSAQLIAGVSGDWGWPRVISNLKSLLETGEVLALA